ncbi:MAG: GDP-mannose 4,6-dehydratase, partial [Pyrinomonadaceae bacterium]
YAVTKAAAELLCHTYSYLYGIRCLVLRFFTAYGARQRPDLAIHKFAQAISSGEPITLYGDGTTERDYTYVDDIISGVRAALDFDASNFEIINLGESKAIPLGRIVELLEKELGKKAIIERLPEQPGDVKRTFADISKARSLLGYAPQTSIEDGIKKFVEWFINNPGNRD